MAFASWKESYSVGVAAIDDQHKSLFKMVGELNDAMSKGRGKDVLDGILDRLIRYTATHFREEEAAMQRCGYPNLAAHKLEHQALTNQALGLQKNFRAGKLMMSVEIMTFLTNWLDKHITKVDMQYAPHMVK